MATTGSYRVAAICSADALANRLASARQRAAGLLIQACRDAERDGGRLVWESQSRSAADLRWERQQVASALQLLCESRPLRETTEERINRRDAMEQLGARPEPERKMLREHLGLCR